MLNCAGWLSIRGDSLYLSSEDLTTSSTRWLVVILSLSYNKLQQEWVMERLVRQRSGRNTNGIACGKGKL